MDQPMVTEGTEEKAEEIEEGTDAGPQGINLHQQIREVSQGDLREQEEDDRRRNQEGDEKPSDHDAPERSSISATGIDDHFKK